MTTTTYTAVVDRIEDGLAVLLVEEEGDVVDEAVVPVYLVPSAGRTQDAVFVVEVAADGSTTLEYDPDETARRSHRAQSRFDRLSRPLSGPDADGADEGDSDGAGDGVATDDADDR
jgi:hypothetical protein